MKKLTKKLEEYWDMRIGDTISGMMFTNCSKDEIVKKIEHIFRKRLGANEQEAREETAKAYKVAEFWMLPENCLIEEPGPDLRCKNYQEADLRGADLQKADLRGVNFISANLQGANLEGADLRGAILGKADMSGANLWGVKIMESQKDQMLECLRIKIV